MVVAREESARQELADFLDLLDILDDPDQNDRQLQVSAALVHRAESSPAIRRYAFVQREIDLVAAVLQFLSTTEADADVTCNVLALLLTLIVAADGDDPAIQKRNIAVLHKHPLSPLQSLHALLTLPPILPPQPSALQRSRLAAQILEVIRASPSPAHDTAFLSGIRAAARAGTTALALLAALVSIWNAVGTREAVAQGCAAVIVIVLEDAKWNQAWWERKGECATGVARCMVEAVRSGPSAALTPVCMAVLLRHCARVRAMHTALCPATQTFLTSIPPAIHAHLLTIESFLTAYHVTNPTACLHILSAIYLPPSHKQSSLPPLQSPPPPIPQPPLIDPPTSPAREAHAAGAFAISILSKSIILGASTPASTAEFLTLCALAMRRVSASVGEHDCEHADEELQHWTMQRGLAAQCEAAATRVLVQDARRWGLVVRLFPPAGDAVAAVAPALVELAPVVARAGGEAPPARDLKTVVAATARQKPGACDALIIAVLKTIEREVVATQIEEAAASGGRRRRPLTAVAALPSVGRTGVTALASEPVSVASRAAADVASFITNDMPALIDFLQSRVLRPSTLHPTVTACIRTVLPTLIAHTQAPDPPPPLPLPSRGMSLPNLARATGARRLEPLREVVGVVATTASIVQPRPPVTPPPASLRTVGGLGPGMGTGMGRKVALR
ncbi:hypothetical protein HDU87_007212 [Geranomyces variabilis]|uniref:Uncharacterized protein n=1 Tax=Geranomyces variabilis TaxID=109894 RepID=A0AAD5TGW8_9FUNG|nr:hypothetical protein HDU87_007212 [Geranomyces variabilis]